MKRSWFVIAAAFSLLHSAFAGGPLLVGGPTHGVDGVPMTWANGVVNYRVDGGNFSAGVSNATGIARVQSMFSTWTSVPTASITATNLGAIQPTGAFSDGDVSTVAEFNAVSGACDGGSQSPIIFDANGTLFQALVGDPGVIGFAGPCVTNASGNIVSGMAMMNGAFQDGINNSTNYEITSAQFDEALTHEIGHFLGMDHSQINVQVMNDVSYCGTPGRAGIPIMFPYIICDARINSGLPKLSPDDIAWISKLYPNSGFNANYGVISGRILFTDGIEGFQGANVIARSVSDPDRVAFSNVSGFLFTGNPGQSVTGDNAGGDDDGSRNPAMEGYFEIPVPPGQYTLEIEAIHPLFSFGSSVGPPVEPYPITASIEYWDSNESSTDDPAALTVINVSAGAAVTGKNIILNGTPPRFDNFEEE